MMEQYKWESKDSENIPQDLRLSKYAGEHMDVTRTKNLIMHLHKRLTEAESRLARQDDEIKSLKESLRAYKRAI